MTYYEFLLNVIFFGFIGCAITEGLLHRPVLTEWWLRICFFAAFMDLFLWIFPW